MFFYIITGLAMGFVFGFALEKGRVFEPGMIIGQFQMRRFVMLKMFMTAMATTMVVYLIMTSTGLADFSPKAAVYPAVIFGGLIFGCGMALSGACPGTALAQIGAGYIDGLMVLIGGMFGSMLYGYYEPTINAMSDGPGKVTLADVTGLPFSLLAGGFVVAIVVGLFFLEKAKPWRDDLGPDLDGCVE